MRNKYVFLSLTILTGCIKLPDDDYRYSPPGLDASILISYDLVSYSTTEILYDVKIASFSYYNDWYYEKSSYELSGPGNLEVMQIEGMELNNNTTSANVLLIDQSGSYTEIDPHNIRTKIINKFLDDFTPPDNHLVGGFSSNGLLTEQPVLYASSDFSSTWNNQGFLFELTKLTGGKSSLYDGLNSAIEKLSSRNESSKNIIAIVRANDGGSIITASELINKANANSVKIFLLMLGSEPTPSTLWELSNQTNGMMADCPQTLHMVTILNHLQRLIRGSVYISKLRIRFTPDSGIINSGDTFENQIMIHDSLYDYDFNPVYIKIKIP